MRTSPWLTLILLLPLFADAQYTTKAPIIGYDNCEVDPVWEWDGDRTRKWSYWTGSNHILPGNASTSSMTRSSAFSRKGNYSYKARIVKDPNYNENAGTHRSELVFSTPSQAPIGWRWAAVSVYLPADLCIDQAPMSIVFSTKANPDNWATPFRIDVRKGRYIAIRANVQTNGTVNGELEQDLGPIDRGEWVDWVYHRNFEMNSSGYLEVYKNGKLVYSFNGPNWVNGSGRTTEGYLPVGLYKWVWTDPSGMGWGPPACNNPVEVYYDEYRFGTDAATLQDFLIDQEAPLPRPVGPSVAKSIADQNLDYNSSTSLTIPLSGVFADDGGAANLQLTVSGNSNATLIKSATVSGTNLLLNIAADKSGTSAIKIKATDKDGLSVEDEFSVNVAAYVPVAPTVSKNIADQNLAYNTSTLTVPLTGIFADEGGASNLQLTVSGNSNTVLIKSATVSGTNLLLSIAAEKSGTSAVTIKATDADGLSVEDEFNITIAAYIPEAPVVANPVADVELAFNTASKSVSLANVFSDDKAVSELTYTITGNSNSALISDAVITGNTLSITFITGIAGSSNITVKALDADGLAVSDQFTVTVDPEIEIPSFSLLINSGGTAVNFNGESWVADKNFSGGKAFTNATAIAGTTNDTIYQSERYGTMSYAIPVTAGKYTVRLHFAEIFHTTTNKRKFNVSIENAQASLTNYDIVANAGAAFTARLEEFKDITVTDSTLNISFTSVLDNAKVSAIEIIGAPVNKAPTVAAALADQALGIEIKTKSISLASVFADDKGAANLTYTVSGNTNKAVVSTAVISGTTVSLGLTGTAVGKSAITIRATDAGGLYVDNSFNITVTNKAPLANAGADQTITLPVSQTVLNGSGSDSDGSIKAYTWSQVSGPTATFSSKTVAKPTINGLSTAGTYVFQLKVTDNINVASTNDQVNIIVKPVPGLHLGSFTLINAASDNDIMTITNGAQINLASTGGSLNIRANTLPGTAGRVVFALSGTSNYSPTETSAPFALFGDASGNYNNWTPAPGTYTLKATPYTTATGGIAGEPLTVTFTIINQAGADLRAITINEATTPLQTIDKDLKQMNDAPVITTLNAYPNPVTSQVTIGYKTAKSAKLMLEVINAEGKTVQRWPEENVYPGVVYRKTMNASKLPNGIYIYRITTSTGEVKTGRIVVAK